MKCGNTIAIYTNVQQARHQRICAKNQNTSKKRKTFDSSKQRQCADLKAFLATHGRAPTPKQVKKDWKKKHETLVESLRAARTVSEAIKTGDTTLNSLHYLNHEWFSAIKKHCHLTYTSTSYSGLHVQCTSKPTIWWSHNLWYVIAGAPLPPHQPSAPDPDYVQCPYCERRFQESAAERHIPFCKEQKSRIERKPSSKAQDKLNKRLQVNSQ